MTARSVQIFGVLKLNLFEYIQNIQTTILSILISNGGLNLCYDHIAKHTKFEIQMNKVNKVNQVASA